MDKEGYFADPSTLRAVCNSIGNLKIVDPACGSGHFLTAVLGEIHRIRMSLLRGLKGERLDPIEVYKAKKETVLRSIYGVDINPIAVEIAKLRIWLKMVEDGWRAEFGDLPNIDVNIIPGNSLIGLPTRSAGQSMFGTYQLDFDAIKNVRDQYKKGLINRRRLTETITRLNPELNGLFLESLYHFFEDSIGNITKFDNIFSSNGLDSVIKNIKIKRRDNASFSESESDELKRIGFKIHSKSARLDNDQIGRNIGNLRKLVQNDFVIHLERRPLNTDLEELLNIPNLSYKPFHWVMEFPEAVSIIGDKPTVKFDIVIGNPPYGDILKDVEKKFIAGYVTSDVNDISAQFIERELQILDVGGYFGNILTLRFVYQSNASSVRNLIRRKMENTKIACFATRPSKIFNSSDPRVAITTGIRLDYEGDITNNEGFDIYTSNFIRISKENRAGKIKNITYESTNGLVLGETIGSIEDYSLPKIGNPTIRNILEILKSRSSRVFRHVENRGDNLTGYLVWRSYHPQYWINPCLENIYSVEKKPRDFLPMAFNSELNRDLAFLIMQSSLFYLYWMVYENQRDLNWGTIEAFPFPEDSDIQSQSDQIKQLTGILWDEMKRRFDPTAGINGEIQRVSELKLLINQIDDLIGPIYGLSPEQIEYVKQYDAEYRTVSEG
jgi:hypothetical protein